MKSFLTGSLLALVSFAYAQQSSNQNNSTPSIQLQADSKVRPSLALSECCAFIGVNFNQISNEKAKRLGFDNPYGLYVTTILANSAAEKAGVQPFDYIYGIDEYRVGQDQTLGYILKKYSPGDKATLHIMRRGRWQTLPITFGRREDARGVYRSECEEAFFGIRQNNEVPSKEGIPVTIIANSTAKELGMEDGDVILTINGHKMIDWTDISTAVNNMQVGEKIRVEYMRGNQKRSGSHTIKSHCDTNEATYSFNNAQRRNWTGKGNTIVIENINVRNVQVNIEDVSTIEIRSLQEKNVEIAAGNSLRPQRLDIQPNTAGKNVFYLQFVLPSRGDTSIRIFNEAGRLIYEYELTDFSGTFNDEVNLLQNGMGTYYLTIKQGNNRLTKKVVLKKI